LLLLSVANAVKEAISKAAAAVDPKQAFDENSSKAQAAKAAFRTASEKLREVFMEFEVTCFQRRVTNVGLTLLSDDGTFRRPDVGCGEGGQQLYDTDERTLQERE
jgi:hypothetical protein